MILIEISMTGRKALLMHNERLASQLDEYTIRLKEITSKTKKTDDDHLLISRRDFEGGLYHDEAAGGPYIPGRNISAALVQAGKKFKLGKAIVEAVIVLDEMIPLEYKGPRDIEGLWSKKYFDRRTVGNQAKRVLRTRPRFPEWKLRANVLIDTAMVDIRTMREVLARSQTLGLGDYRPHFGTFDASLTEVGEFTDWLAKATADFLNECIKDRGLAVAAANGKELETLLGSLPCWKRPRSRAST